jgi:hypothetical protein
MVKKPADHCLRVAEKFPTVVMLAHLRIGSSDYAWERSVAIVHRIGGKVLVGLDGGEIHEDSSFD